MLDDHAQDDRGPANSITGLDPVDYALISQALTAAGRRTAIALGRDRGNIMPGAKKRGWHMRHATTVPDAVQASEPDWLAEWRRRPRGAAQTLAGALARFDALTPLEPEEMLGHWRGTGLHTGHPLDGVLEALGWHGKAFETPDRVQPLLFRTGSGRVVALDPGLMPVGTALRWPWLARSALARVGLRMALPLVRARRPAARLRKVWFRGKVGSAMIYDRQPTIDHFRRIDGSRVLGLMEMRADMPPFFFLLARIGGGGHSN
jgi:hypothetical protein